MLTERQIKFGENIRRELSKIVLDHEITVNGLNISLVRAIPSADFGVIKVYFRIIDSKYADIVKKALDFMSNTFSVEITKKVRLKKFPSFIFFYDDMFECGQEIEELIAKINQD